MLRSIARWQTPSLNFWLSVNDQVCAPKSQGPMGNKILTRVHIFFGGLCFIGVNLFILTQIKMSEICPCREKQDFTRSYCNKPKYWYTGNDYNLQNLHAVLQRIGYEKASEKSPWTLYWGSKDPFKYKLTPQRKVNRFPGSGALTSKVSLATTESTYIPKAFKFPRDKTAFLKYAEEHKDTLFLEKKSTHRGISIKNITEINLKSGKTFVQEFMQKPLLIDGHKFDIGVFVALTSVNPLRAYWYKADMLFRFCKDQYYPFDPKKFNKYVVADGYLKFWKIPSLSYPFTELGYGMKDVFDIYMKSKGIDPKTIWEDVLDAITDVMLKKEKDIIKIRDKYPPQDSFFEIMRFDLILDENLKVYLLEANIPDLNSKQEPSYKILNEQLFYNLFTLVGVADHLKQYNASEISPQEQQAAKDMLSAQKNIAVWGEECITTCRNSCIALPVCNLCNHCTDANTRETLLKTYREHLHRGEFRRLWPPPMDANVFELHKLKGLSKNNELMYLWCQGKCNIDITWCT